MIGDARAGTNMIDASKRCYFVEKDEDNKKIDH